MSQLLGKTLKVLGAAALLYGAYKLGKGMKSEPINNFVVEEDKNECEEEKYITELIGELKNKPNKTKKDKYNIELLEVKLNQIKSKK
jgi:hypothetical protein